MVSKSSRPQKSFFRRIRVELLGRKRSDAIFNIILYICMTVFTFITLYPFFYVLLESLKSVVPNDAGTPKYELTLSAYGHVLFGLDGFMQSFVWSLFIAVLSTVLHVFCCMLTAYPLSKKHLRGRKAILLFILFTMLFHGGLIPSYLLMRTLHLFNNPLIYILPGLVTGFDVIIAKNFMGSIPESLSESAQIDGATDYRIFLQIYLPMSMPIMATLALWHFVGKWNDWMTGLLYMNKRPDLALIQTFLRRVLISASTQSSGGGVDLEIISLATSVRMAIIVVGLLPIVLIYPFVQKYFVKGALLGSIKG